jgi:hypothetical protein
MAIVAREDVRNVAGRLVIVALLVVGVTAHAGELSSSIRRFQLGPPVRDTTYVARFAEIAAADGRPYRDFPVEYPPVSLAVIEIAAGSDRAETGAALVWLMGLFDLLTVAALALGWSRRTAVFYLLLTVPLLGFLLTTIDLVSVALAVAGVALVVRGRDRAGGVALAAAILAKVWPVAVLPLLIVQRRWRALWWSAGALAVGTAIWVWWSGPSGPFQVATQRDTPGWEYESLVGSVLWALGRTFVTIKNSSRIGVAPGWVKALLLGAAAVGIAAVWLRAYRREPREIGMPSVAAVSILMLSAPLLSPPYMIWLAPWAAIACTERRSRFVRWLLVSVMLVSGLMLVASSALADVALWSVKALLLVRNGLLVAVPAVYLLERPEDSPATGLADQDGAEARRKIMPSASS